MSMTFNMVGGGGLSNTSAILAVTVPTGSSVKIAKGAVTLYPVIWDKNSENTKDVALFVIGASLLDSTAWTIIATLSTSTASSTIVIDTAEEYEIELSYHVPLEYQEVEYIQSTGSQYINTNYVVNANDSFEIIAQMTAWGSSGYPNDSIIFEATSWAQNRCVIEFNGSHGARVVWGNNSYRDSSNWVTDLNTDFTFNVYPNLVFNGVDYGGVGVTAQSRPGFLFAANDVGALTRLSYLKLKYFKITDSSNVVQRKFYPCYRKSDSVAGLWDKKNEVFYTNAGSGSFIVGSDVGGGNIPVLIIVGTNINSSGKIIGNSSYQMAYAPITQGFTYTATSNNTTLTAGFFTDVPVLNATSYDGVRISQSGMTFIAPISGYIAWRNTNGFENPTLMVGGNV